MFGPTDTLLMIKPLLLIVYHFYKRQKTLKLRNKKYELVQAPDLGIKKQKQKGEGHQNGSLHAQT